MNKNALGLILSGILIGSIVGVLGVKTFIFDPEIHEYQSTIRYIENTNRDLETQKKQFRKRPSGKRGYASGERERASGNRTIIFDNFQPI